MRSLSLAAAGPVILGVLILMTSIAPAGKGLVAADPGAPTSAAEKTGTKASVPDVTSGRGAPPTPGQGPAEEKKPLSPVQVFQGKVEGQVCLEFVVGAVSIGHPTVLEAADRLPEATIDGSRSLTRLQVKVGEKVEARLNELGIEDLRRHLYRKLVCVSGTLKRVVDAGGVGNPLITYQLTLEHLDQIESVKKIR